MEQLKQQISAIRSAKTIPDLFRSISAGTLENLALVPLMLFVYAPIDNFLWNLIGYYSIDLSLSTLLDISMVIGVLVLLLALGKVCTSGESVKPLISRNAPMVWLSLFALLVVVSTCLNGFTQYALQGDSYRNESMFTYISYIAIFFFCATLVQSPKKKAAVMYLMLAASVLLAVCGMLHRWVIPFDTFSNDRSMNITTIYHNSNHYGYYLVFAVLASGGLFVFEKRKSLRVLALVSFLVNNVVLVLNNTFGAYLGCMIALFFQVIVLYIIHRRINRPTLVLLGLMLAVSAVMGFWVDNVFRNFYELFIDFNSLAKDEEDACSAGSGRWKLWEHTLQYIGEKPIFGHGVEGISQRLYEESGDICDRSHNEILQYAAFFGIPAAIVYMIGVFRVYWNGLKLKSALDGYTISCLVMAFGYLTSSLVGNTTYYISPLFFIFLGLGFLRSRET